MDSVNKRQISTVYQNDTTHAQSKKSRRDPISTKWLTKVNEMTKDEWKILKCCKKWKCFQSCEIDYLCDNVKKVIEYNQLERRRYLHSMMNSSKQFFFNGRPVCAEFLSKSFRFSRDLQCAIKRGNWDTPNRSTEHNFRRSPLTERIIAFLSREADLLSNRMPDCDEIHLPYRLKCHVYQRFSTDYARLYNEKPPSRSFFSTIWNSFCNNIKVRKVSKFSKCTVCEQIDNELMKSRLGGRSTAEILKKKEEHINFVMRERVEYRKKQELAKIEPSRYLSIIIDGADQSAYGLPHFCSSTKDQRGESLKVKVVGVLEHKVKNKLLLLTMTDDYESGSNHIIESLHRYFIQRDTEGHFPETLFVQFDNCTRENKNKYTMAYLESLVSWGMFKEVIAAFLPVGHTHEDIDQAFSCTSRRLRTNDAITLEDLQSELKHVYNEETKVISMEKIANFSGLCENENILNKIPPFSHLRYFKFKSNGKSTSADLYLTECHVKDSADSDWQLFQTTNRRFTIRTPNLSKTPPTTTNNSQANDQLERSKKEFTDRMLSEEYRINDRSKISKLKCLREKVFSQRSERFHWNVTTCPELKSRDLSNEIIDMDRDVIQEEEIEEVLNDFDYGINSFVAINPDMSNNAEIPFWIAKINKVLKNKNGIISHLLVQWYELSSGCHDIYLDRYHSCSIPNKRTKKCTPWTSKVSCDTVILKFDNLLSNNRLPSQVHKKLRLEVNSRG